LVLFSIQLKVYLAIFVLNKSTAADKHVDIKFNAVRVLQKILKY